jgi:hypothetical protein
MRNPPLAETLSQKGLTTKEKKNIYSNENK